MRQASSYLRGPFTALGLGLALVVCLIDQASKLWLVFGYDLGARSPVVLAPVLDLILVRNYGISYGLLQGLGTSARWVLVLGTGVAVAFLWTWLARAGTKLTAAALGLIIGGAAGNAVDRVLHGGAVIDFLRFHLTTATFDFNWYVFNLADAAIVAGVAALLYDSFLGLPAAKAP